nr:3-deoxy-manno-octulosonate cytidylyltransferase [uncultured Lichenicoccus sp.]
MNPLVLIPARMASTRLPGKPLALIAGRPMILHVLERALRAGIGPVAVAVCDADVRDVVQQAGGTAVMTDPGLPSGSDRVHAAAEALDPGGEHDTVVNLQGDLPGLPPGDLGAVLGPLRAESEGRAAYDIATLVTPITGEEEARATSVVKVACAFASGAGHARALYFSRAAIPWGDGPLWHHVGVYAYRREALRRFVSLPTGLLEQRESLEQLRALEAGMRIGCTQVAAPPFGVDTPDDLARARRVLEGGAS